MPLGIERINARRKQPNDRINFIKPLDGPDKAYAEDFLERIAAICNPIMKANHLAVMSLEEFSYNTEFLGRNFNAGEVIQLVLKARSGHWLPFRFVQMVMMHELAHIKQMNHSKAFWKVKEQFSDELRALWAKGYTGEGMWSRGRTLLNGEYDSRGLGSDEVLPEHLCGGTYRSSGKRKRASKPKLNWKEQKERRIAKKFGVNGVALGADDQVKTELENGKKTASKPRVAGSNRGRELRAAAALARFEVKKEEPEVKDEADIETESASETDSDWEFDATIKTEPGEAMDIDGKKMRDSKGRGMVKVCDDEDGGDVNVKNEMDELSELRTIEKYFPPEPKVVERVKKEPSQARSAAPSKIENIPPSKKQTTINLVSPTSMSTRDQMPAHSPPEATKTTETKGEPIIPPPSNGPAPSQDCPICSFHNNDLAVICEMCKHVLNERRVRGAWRCHSVACQGSTYLNAGDAARCGICGTLGPGKTAE